MGFQLRSSFEPRGDQPEAIATLVRGVDAGERHQVLTGTEIAQCGWGDAGATSVHLHMRAFRRRINHQLPSAEPNRRRHSLVVSFGCFPLGHDMDDRGLGLRVYRRTSRARRARNGRCCFRRIGRLRKQWR